MNRLSKIAIAGTVAVATLLGGTPAGAASSGASVYQDSDCFFQSHDQSTACYSVPFVDKYTETPSGNVALVSNGSSYFSVVLASGELYTSYDVNYHSATVLRAGETGVHHFDYEIASTFGGPCLYSIKYQFVNGEVKYFDESFTCG